MTTSESCGERMVASAEEVSFVALDACWVCGSRDLERVGHRIDLSLSAFAEQDPGLAAYSGQRIELMRCEACGFGQPQALPTLDGYFGRIYRQQWSDEWIAAEFGASGKDAIFRATIRQLTRLRGTPGTLIDVGCHVGRLIHLAVEAGWKPEGIEVNPRTSAFAERTTRRPIHRVTAGELARVGRRFDAVTLIDVLEHIPSPMNALRELHDVLTPGGWIVVKVPHGPNQLTKERIRGRVRAGYKPNVAENLVHVNHFSPRALRMALERSGFVDVRISSATPEQSPESWPTAKRLRRDALPSAVHALASVLPLGVHTPLTMNLQAIGRRPAR